MKKSLKIALIFAGILIGIIILDTIQGVIFNNRSIIEVTRALLNWKDHALSINEDRGSNNNEFDFFISKPEFHHDIRFDIYYEITGRKIYLAGNLEEFYIKEQDKDITLKDYLSSAHQTIDDEIKNITDKLELKKTLRDGGTKIYKSKEKDITMIICNTTKNDNNIFIGDYSMEYVDGDCRN